MCGPLLKLPAVAASGMTLTKLDEAVDNGSSSTTHSVTIDTSSHDDSAELVASLSAFELTNENIETATLDGVSATSLVSQTTINGRPCLAYARFPGQAYADSATLTITSTDTFLSMGAVVFTTSKAITSMTTIFDQNGNTNDDIVDMSADTTTGAAIMGAIQNNNGGSTEWDGLTEATDQDVRSGDHHSVAIANNITGETPRSMTSDQTSAQRTAGLAVEII